MDFLDFSKDFLALPGVYNPIARQRELLGYWKPFYRATIDGDRFELLVILEPMSEEAEVLNNIVSFEARGGKFADIVFYADHQESQISDIEIGDPGCRLLMERLKAFCEKALPSEELIS